jgi:hypothetical protein
MKQHFILANFAGGSIFATGAVGNIAGDALTIEDPSSFRARGYTVSVV